MQGAGTLLGAAAGEAASLRRSRRVSEEPDPPSAHLSTLKAVAFHLLHHGELDAERMKAELESVAQAQSRALHHGHPVNVSLSSSAIPLGLWYRHDATALVDVVGRLGSLQLATPETVAAALTVGAAVAATTYGQRHLDVWHAVIETVHMHEHARHSELGNAIPDAWHTTDREGHVSLLSTAPVRAVLHTAKLASHDDSAGADGVVRDATTSSAHFGFFVGAMVGARHGIRTWGWPVPEADWYSEVGRRLMENRADTSGLADPGASAF